MVDLFKQYPWLLPLLSAMGLFGFLWLVWFLITNAAPDDEVIIWLGPIRFTLRRGRARDRARRRGGLLKRALRALKTRKRGVNERPQHSPEDCDQSQNTRSKPTPAKVDLEKSPRTQAAYGKGPG